ncbi:hypothetical protein BH18VER1_BH18VER1_06770 [soil metagenome]
MRSRATRQKPRLRGPAANPPGVKASAAPRNLRLPSGIRPRLRLRLYADEKPISERDALIGRQHEGIVRKSIKCGGHGWTIRLTAWCVESDRGEKA